MASRRIAVLTGLGAMAQILGFGYRVVMSRMVGAEVMGLYQLVMSAYGVIQSLTMIGLTAALSNLTARYLARGDYRSAREVRNSALKAFFFSLAIVGLVTIVASDSISVYILGDARTRLGLILLIPCGALTGIENLHKNIFYGAARPLGPAVAEVVEQVVRAGAVLGLLFCFLPQYPERTVGLILTGMVLCEVVSASVMLGLYRRFTGKMPRTGRTEKGMYREMGTIALPVGLNALVGTALGAANSALLPQKLLEGGMGREQAISQLGVISGMTMPMLAMPTVFLGAINLVLMPKVAGAYALGQYGELEKLGRQGVGSAAKLAFPAMAMMTVVGQDLGMLLFGREDTGAFLAPLAAATLMSCFCSVFSGLLNNVGQQQWVAAVSIFGGVVQLLCTLTLAARPEIGLGGYVFGTVLALALEVGLLLILARRTMGLRPDWYSWLIAPGLAAALGAANAKLLILWLKGQGVPMLYSDGMGCIFALIQYMTALRILTKDTGRS